MCFWPSQIKTEYTLASWLAGQMVRMSPDDPFYRGIWVPLLELFKLRISLADADDDRRDEAQPFQGIVQGKHAPMHGNVIAAEYVAWKP